MRKIYIPLGVVLVLSVFFYSRWNGIEPTETSEPRSDDVNKSDNQNIAEEDVLAQSEEDRLIYLERLHPGAHDGERIAPPTLSYMRVELPQPLDEPWRAFVIDSVSAFRDEGMKEIGLGLLPNWIRKALREGKNEEAARYLNTLILLVEDESLKISDRAMIELYRLGDINEIAFRKIQARLKNEAENYFFGDDNNYLDQRQQILNDLLFYDDRRFDDEIYNLWQSKKDMDMDLSKIKGTSFPDFAHYLEEVGVDLPLDYWHSRINVPANWENTYDILERRGNEATARMIKDYFLTTEKADRHSIARMSRPIVAAIIYKLTDKPEYLDFVEATARSVQSNYGYQTDQEAFNALSALAKASPEKAMPLLENTRWEGDIGSTALDALALIPDKESTDIISKEAIRVITETGIFPSDALEALARQNTEYAGNRYDEIRQEFLSGKYGWTGSTTINNFDRLDFIRYNR